MRNSPERYSRAVKELPPSMSMSSHKWKGLIALSQETVQHNQGTSEGFIIPQNDLLTLEVQHLCEHKLTSLFTAQQAAEEDSADGRDLDLELRPAEMLLPYELKELIL